MTVVYVGSRTTWERAAHGCGITVFRVGEHGRWETLQSVDATNPSWLALDPSGRRLYTVHGDGTSISAYAIDPQHGGLTHVDTHCSQHANPVHLVHDLSSRWLLVSALESPGAVYTVRLRRDGTFGGVASTLAPAAFAPHQALFDRRTGHVLICDGGASRVVVCRFDTTRGSLDPVAEARMLEPGKPRHAAFHPTLPLVFVLDESRSTVTTFRWDPPVLTPLDSVRTRRPGESGESCAAELVIAASGRHVYASNRSGGDDRSRGGPDADSIAILSLDRSAGTLSTAGWVSSGGIRPRFFCRDPTGNRMYVANERSHTVVAFSIDRFNGGLRQLGVVAETGSPVSMVFRSMSA